MAKLNLNKSEEFVTNRPQHQSTHQRGLESSSIKIPPFRPHFIIFSKNVFYEVNLASQCSHLDVLFLCNFLPETDADSP